MLRIADLLLAALCLGLTHLLLHPYRFEGVLAQQSVILGRTGLELMVIINVMLAVLNLLPIPPLDGSRIWPCVIPGMKPSGNKRFNQIGMYVLIGVLVLGGFNKVLTPIMNAVTSAIPSGDDRIVAQRIHAGSTLYANEDDAGAERLFTSALAINPKDALGLHWRAVTRLSLDKTQEALGDIDRAIAIHPATSDYHDVRARCLEKLGRQDEARQARTLAKALGGSATTHPAEE